MDLFSSIEFQRSPSFKSAPSNSQVLALTFFLVTARSRPSIEQSILSLGHSCYYCCLCLDSVRPRQRKSSRQPNGIPPVWVRNCFRLLIPLLFQAPFPLFVPSLIDIPAPSPTTPLSQPPPSPASHLQNIDSSMNSINAMFSRFRRPGNKQPSSPQQQTPGNGGGSGFNGGGAGQGGPPSGGLLPNTSGSTRVATKPLFLCKPFVTSQLVKGSFSTIVVLPKYVDQGEWLALNGMYDNEAMHSSR